MGCDEIREWLAEYTAGTMAAERTMAIENHFDTCPSCRQEWERFHAVRSALRNRAAYHTAPPGLRQRILNALPSALSNEPIRQDQWKFSWAQTPVAAALAVIAFLAGGWWSPFARTTVNLNEDRLIRELASNHVRSLLANHLMDVASTDQHTVKPWFIGKLDFAPTVVDLKEKGFPLVGGRLDAVAGHPVAALVYHRQKHIINLLIWPSADSESSDKNAGMVSATYRGYHILHWQQSEMTYAVISDLNERELQEFAHLLKP